eukprot:TRINITY_DN67882_c6_g1_i1.p2 TRINITY_DN67882_c6_g1~~TRINITY_DN67882_c6_g1_i1.p2  ORF type:complete len:103 (-),score=14.89 TRINITY_DN67882_c6_g1_i1:174-482(-)
MCDWLDELATRAESENREVQAEIVAKFKEHRVQQCQLPWLTEAHLKEMFPQIGTRLNVSRAIQNLNIQHATSCLIGKPVKCKLPWDLSPTPFGKDDIPILPH